MGKSKTIGLVLHDSIGYSETFFFKEIGIHKQLGFSTIVFTNYTARTKSYHHVVGLPKTKIDTVALIKALFFLFKAIKPVIRLYQLEKSHGTSLKNRLKIIYLNLHILKEKVDCLYFGFGTSSLGKELIAKAMGVEMLLSFRGADLMIYPIGKTDVYKKALTHADRIHVVSMDLHRIVSALLIQYQCTTPIHKITPAISSHLISPKQNPGTLGIPVNILTIGRLHWKKGFQYLLPAIKKIKDTGLNITCTIIGDGESKTELLYLIESLGLNNTVRLLGRLAQEDVYEQLKSADVYIQPSIQEGFCNALLEAQASGLLVLACDAEGIRENVEDGKSGWIVERMSINAIANGFLKLIELPGEKRKEVAEYAIARVQEQFDLSFRLKDWQHFFNKV